MDLVPELRRNARRSWERYVVTLFILRPQNIFETTPIGFLGPDSRRFQATCLCRHPCHPRQSLVTAKAIVTLVLER